MVTEWKTWPGFSRYEASHRGLIRNRAEKTLAARADPDGYLRTTLTRDDDERIPVLVHRAVLEAHAGPCPPGMESCHGKGGQLDNRYPENLRWDTHQANERDKGRRPPVPKPPAPCINHDRCGGFVGKGGRRCHECVMQLGKDGAELVWDGMTLEAAGDKLGYPAVHLHTLMVKYGDYGQRPPAAPSRSVFAAARARFRRGDAA